MNKRKIFIALIFILVAHININLIEGKEIIPGIYQGENNKVIILEKVKQVDKDNIISANDFVYNGDLSKLTTYDIIKKSNAQATEIKTNNNKKVSLTSVMKKCISACAEDKVDYYLTVGNNSIKVTGYKKPAKKTKQYYSEGGGIAEISSEEKAILKELEILKEKSQEWQEAEIFNTSDNHNPINYGLIIIVLLSIALPTITFIVGFNKTNHRVKTIIHLYLKN